MNKSKLLFLSILFLYNFCIESSGRSATPWPQPGQDDGSWSLPAVISIVIRRQSSPPSWPQPNSTNNELFSPVVSAAPSRVASRDSFFDENQEFYPVEVYDESLKTGKNLFANLSVQCNQLKFEIEQSEREGFKYIKKYKMLHSFILLHEFKYTVMHARWGSLRKKHVSLGAEEKKVCAEFLNNQAFRHQMWDQCVQELGIVDECCNEIKLLLKPEGD